MNPNDIAIPDFTSPEFTDYGVELAVPDFASPEYTDYGPPPAPRRTLVDDLIGAAGSAGRGGYKGALSLPALVTDPLVAAINELFGTDILSMSESVDAAADQLGVPALEGRPGQLVENLSGAGASALTGAGLAARAATIPRNAQGIPANVLRTLGEQPMGQAAAAGAGAYGAHVAREQGLGEGGQLAAGMAAATIAPVIGGAGSLTRSVMTGGGRADTAAQALRALTRDPDSALQNINDFLARGQPLRAKGAPATLPRYRPPSATVAADEGLLSVHESVRSLPGITPRFVQQESQNNAAILGYLAQKFGPSAASIIAKRDAVLAPRIKTLAQNSRPTNPTPFMAKLDALEMVPRGQDAEARQIVAAIRKEFDSLFDRGGFDWITNPVYLYQGPRKTIAAMIEKKAAGDTPLTKNSLVLAKKLRDSIDDVIDDGMPGYKDYWMRPWAAASQAADRRVIFDDIMQRASATAQTDMQGSPFIQASRFETAMRAVTKRHGNQPTDFSRLTQKQRQALLDVQTELRRGAMLGAARMRGSDTFKNLTMGALVGRLVSGGGLGDDAPKWVRTLSERIPIRVLGDPDQDVITRLADALLDPEMAKHLLVRANQLSADSFSKAMSRRMTAAGVGSTQVE